MIQYSNKESTIKVYRIGNQSQHVNNHSIKIHNIYSKTLATWTLKQRHLDVKTISLASHFIKT